MRTDWLFLGVWLFPGMLLSQSSPLVGNMLRSGTAAYEQGQYLEAEREYRKVLDLDPECVEALFNLSASLFQQSRYPQAIEALERSLALETNSGFLALVHYNLGTNFMATEAYAAASEAFQAALRLNPSMESARHNLGLAIQQISNQDPASQKHTEDSSSSQQEEQQEEQAESPSDESPDNTPPSDQPPATPMTPEEAAQMLRRLEFQEQQVQQQIRKRQQRNRIRNEKDW